MANMSYCRFQNTLSDLKDCLEHLNDDLSPSEEKARCKMLEVCISILEDSGYDVTDLEDIDYPEDNN